MQLLKSETMLTVALLILAQVDAGSCKGGPMMLETLFVMSAERSPSISPSASAHPGGTLDIAFTDGNRPTRAEIEKRFGVSREFFYTRPCGSVKFSLEGDQVHFVRLGYSTANRYPATR